jgi:hypothetical protein
MGKTGRRRTRVTRARRRARTPAPEQQQATSVLEHLPTDLTALAAPVQIISKSFAVIALRLAPVRPKTTGDRAVFLDALGLCQTEIAGILGSTPTSVGELLSRAGESDVGLSDPSVAVIDPALIERLQKKPGLRRAAVYKRIQQIVNAFHLEHRLAAILLASENGVNTARFATREDLPRFDRQVTSPGAVAKVSTLGAPGPVKPTKASQARSRKRVVRQRGCPS